MALDNDDIKQLIAILQRGLEQSPEDVVSESKPKKSRSVPKPKTKTTKPKRINKFDQMPEYNMCKEDVEIDRKIRKPPPSMRKPEFQFIKAQCRVCGKTEEVAPSLIETMERYKCNKCATGAG